MDSSHGALIAEDFQRIHEKEVFEPPKGSGTVDFGQRKFAAMPGALAPSTLKWEDILRHDDDDKKTTGILLISLGSHKTEGAQLDSIAQWLSTVFDKIYLMPADFIYRLTLQLLNPNLDTAEANVAAVQACHEFKAHASPILAQYSHSCEFEWFPMSSALTELQESFQRNYQVLQDLMENNPEFSQTVQCFSHSYMERVAISEAEEPSERVDKVAQLYLLEECAIFAALGESEEDGVNLIYAGTIDSMIDLCEGKFENQPEGFKNVRFIEAKNERRGQFFPDGTSKVLRTGSLVVGSFKRPTYSDDFLGQLGEEGRQKLFQYTKRKKFRTGQFLVKVGTSGNKLFKGGALYFILDGRVEEFITRAGGTGQQRIGVVDAGSIIIERNFLDPKETNHFLAVPLVETEVQGLTKRKFDQLAKEEPELALKIMSAIAHAQTTRNIALMHELQHMRLQHEMMEDSLSSLGY